MRALSSVFESGYKMKDPDSMVTDIHNEIDKEKT